MKKIRAGQSGFTLIELVVVIVILGILAATAIPKFVDLSAEAELAAVKGVAGGLSSAAAINYAACAAVGNEITSGKCTKVSSCADVANLLTPPLDTTVYTVTPPTATDFTKNGNAVICEVAKADTTYAADFTAITAGVTASE